MKVARIGLTPVKGTRHQARTEVELTLTGPVDDRVFCLVDPDRRQVLRTVATAPLLGISTYWSGGILTADIGGADLSGVPAVTGEPIKVDYWGRQITAQPVSGPWTAAFAEYLNRPVVLASTRVGDIVYGDSVSMVTTASLASLRVARRHPGAATDQLDLHSDSARFRSTFVIDTTDSPHDTAGDEFRWIGHDLDIGSATVRLTGAIVRCAVVDLHPSTGQSDLRLLKALPSDPAGEPVFGLQGEVVQPGMVWQDCVAAVRVRRTSASEGAPVDSRYRP